MASRRIDLSEDGQKLRVEFPYDPRLVDVVRGLPGRRFENLTKSWSCPLESVREVVETLNALGFSIGPAAREAYRRAGGLLLADIAGGLAAAATPGAGPASPGPDAGPDTSTVTVSELNARVRRVLAGAFPDTLWIAGEIAGFDRNRHRAHVHFELVEKAGESEGGALRATVSAVLFERTRRELERKLAASDAPFELKDGLEVRLRVKVDLYEPRGAFQVVVLELDPVHTLGKIAQNRAAVLAELDRLGLRERNRALPWPELPLRVALITSAGSDAYNDFVNELARSGYAFDVAVVDTRMQGQGLERGLKRAIEAFTARASAFDLVAIVRGGGAKTDLLWFDSLAVALAVARCPLKVVSGIGHQRDVSVIDLIAHAEKTPTAAAAAIVARVQEAEERFESAFSRLADAVRRRLSDRRGELGGLARDVARDAVGRAREERARLRAVVRQLAPATRARLRTAGRQFVEARVRLRSVARGQARLRDEALRAMLRRLAPATLQAQLRRRADRLGDLEQRARSLHPAAVVKRGFAIVRDGAGRVLRDAAAARVGETVVAELARGRLFARVERPELSAPTPAPDPGT